MSSSNKILFFVTEDWYFYSHRMPIARAAKQHGYEVFLVTNVNKHRELIEAEGITVIPLLLRRRSKNIFRELVIIGKLIDVCRHLRPDIIHNVAIKPILYGSIVARLLGIPVVVNAFAGLGAIFVNKGLKSLVLKNIVELLFKLMFVSKNVYILFQNPDDRELFVDNNIVSENKTFLIKGSGVDVAKYTYMPDNNSRISVSLISRMLWSKGIKEFVAASIILRDSCSNVEFLLVGQPDDENPASVPSTYLENLNLLDGVRWLGRRNDVSQVMENSSIIVLPSTYGEGVPKVLIEAAAIGRPIVATDIPGCREICRHNINGLLVPPKDPVALAMAIRTLVEDRSMRGKFGKRGREIAVNEFSEEVVIEKTMAMYHELLNKHILPSKET